MAYGSKLHKAIYYKSPPLIKNLIATFYGWNQGRTRFGQIYHKTFQDTDEFQWVPTEETISRQIEELRHLLEFAKINSPYYCSLFKELDFNPNKIESVEKLRRIPLLEKDTFRKRRDEIIILKAFSKRELLWGGTSGTTGMGLRFPETKSSFQRESAFRFHTYYTIGNIKVGDKWAFCAGHPVALPTSDKPPFWVYDFSNKWLFFSSYNMTEKNCQLYLDELEKFAPDMLGGYPSSVYLLAIANLSRNHPVHIKTVFTSSETLFDFQRRVIEESFNCKAYSYYGNGERCGFIFECPERKFHIKMDHSLVEIIKSNGEPARSGEIGTLVCTGFSNYTTPLIRYLVGDTVRLSKETTCRCGRGGILIDELIGRTEDYVLTPDGRYVGRLDHLFKDVTTVKAAQLVQEALDTLIVRIVRDRNYSSKDESTILKEARSRLGNSIRIDFDYVDNIKRTKAGKHRFIVSKLEKKHIYGTDISIDADKVAL